MNAREVLSRISGTTASMRKTRRQISKEIAAEKREAVLALAYELIDRDPNSRWIAYELVQNHPATRDKITMAKWNGLGQVCRVGAAWTPSRVLYLGRRGAKGTLAML